MRAILTRLVGGILVAAATGLGHAGPTVLFEDGRALPVDGVERTEETAFLVLVGGGRISVPVNRIVNWDELEPQLQPASVDPARRVGDSPRSAAEQYVQLIESAAERHDLDSLLLVALAEVGSGFDPTATSPSGASGLLQLSPDVAKRLDVTDVLDPAQNADAGARHLRSLLDQYNGRTDLALAAYRAGDTAVDRHRGVPPYRQTRRFVNRVLERTTEATP